MLSVHVMAQNPIQVKNKEEFFLILGGRSGCVVPVHKRGISGLYTLQTHINH